METKSSSWGVLALFIVSCFVAQTHGSMQEQSILNRFQSKVKPDSNLDTSLFQVDDIVEETNFVQPQKGLKEKDMIEALPGQPPVKFSQYGGYVTVDQSAGRALYYYFVEAQQSKETLPLLLWLNGGPGCSSLAFGAMQELGPFRVLSDGKTLFSNQYSWNNAANVLFLESPAGVGFSYSNKTSDYDILGDKFTASDNYKFLVNWLERFPEYKNRPFYISGESYAGHYVPQLAQTILHHNKKANRIFINLKGIIIGNAVINEETDERGMYDYFANHALASPRDVSQAQKLCDFSPTAGNQSSQCNTALNAIQKSINNIDIYSIYSPLCFSPNVTAQPKKASVLTYDPCGNYYVYAYLNRPEVQEAMHANVTKLTHDWEPCSDIITNWLDSASTMLPLLQEFMVKGLRVWVFSGDNDGRVPVTSTQYSLNKMRLPVKTAWHPWFLKGEVGGYTEVYKGELTFATVRGAGHQVPTYEPARAFSLINHFLNGTPLPDTTKTAS